LTQRFDISMSSHQCGTVVARTEPLASLLDPWCRAHHLEKLWLIDGGFFLSPAAMNPALTSAARALRVAAESGLAV
jgi:choline dehydrogenase-like flavoprotein